MAILYPISLVNLVVEVGTRHSRQILLLDPKIHTSVKFESKRIYEQFIQENASEDRKSHGYVYGKKRVDVNFANIMHYLRHKNMANKEWGVNILYNYQRTNSV